MSKTAYLLPRTDLNGVGGGGGWAYYSDTAHTSASPQSITAGTRTLFTVDGLGATTVTDYLATVPSDVWENGNILNPSEVGERYLVRVDVMIIPTTVTQNEYVTLQLDIGSGSQINIVEKRLPMQKGAGSAHAFSETITIFCLDTFKANGGKFYLTPTTDVTVFDRAISIERTFSP